MNGQPLRLTQAQNMLPGAAARDQAHTWAEIGQLLDISGHRCTPIPSPLMIHLTGITRIMSEEGRDGFDAHPSVDPSTGSVVRKPEFDMGRKPGFWKIFDSCRSTRRSAAP